MKVDKDKIVLQCHDFTCLDSCNSRSSPKRNLVTDGVVEGRKGHKLYLDSPNVKENETQYYFRQYERYFARLVVMGISRKGERPSEGLL
jgi:hypothetical protein